MVLPPDQNKVFDTGDGPTGPGPPGPPPGPMDPTLVHMQNLLIKKTEDIFKKKKKKKSKKLKPENLPLIANHSASVEAEQSPSSLLFQALTKEEARPPRKSSESAKSPNKSFVSEPKSENGNKSFEKSVENITKSPEIAKSNDLAKTVEIGKSPEIA